MASLVAAAMRVTRPPSGPIFALTGNHVPSVDRFNVPPPLWNVALLPYYNKLRGVIDSLGLMRECMLVTPQCY